MSIDVYSLMSGDKRPLEIREYLDSAGYDVLAEVDIEKDRLRVLHRTDGKFRVPVHESRYSEQRAYISNRFIYPEDKRIYLDLTEPETLIRRMGESKYPGILGAQFRVKTVDGGHRWAEEVLLYGEEFGLPKDCYRFYLFDIQLQKNRRLSLAFSDAGKQRRDSSTGLMVGDSFFPAAEAMVSVPLDEGKWCLVFISVEHLKLFREWFGREKSDALLASIGGVLRREAAETSGLAGHLWDDDFLLLTVYDQARLVQLYERLHNEIKAYGISVGFLPALGICLEEPGVSLLSMADRASLSAASIRGNFHSRISLYRPEMGDRTRQEYQLLSQLQQALKNRELIFYLQPQVNVEDGKIVGAEALVRWIQPNGNLVPPGQFIPVLERYGFISELDRYIWRGVCAWLRGWIDAGHAPVPISLNISQTDILTFDVPQALGALAAEFRLSPDLLKPEITESVYVSDVEIVRSTVAKLREKGFRVFMDDFGSGYSSLNMLSSLGVDVVKLDAHFLHLDQGDERGRQILEAVVNMTRRLSLPLVVEGVETEEHVRFLSTLGCRYVQGFHYYRPMPVKDFEALIGDGKLVADAGVTFQAHQPLRVREFLDRNIYSDEMLNEMLGSVAFYAWDGAGKVDILRYNEHFLQVVGDQESFAERRSDILRFIVEADRSRFLTMFREAEAEPGVEKAGIIGVYRSDGIPGRFLIRLHFLEKQGTQRLYFGNLYEFTEFLSLQSELRLLSFIHREAVIFLSPRPGGWAYHVAVYALRKCLGMGREDFQQALDTGALAERVEPEGREAFQALLELRPGAPESLHLRITGADGAKVPMILRRIDLGDAEEDMPYALVLTPEE